MSCVHLSSTPLHAADAKLATYSLPHKACHARLASACSSSCRNVKDRMCLDADRLTMLGPGAIIASLSLGATRTFRVRCVAQQVNSPGRGLPSQQASADRGPSSKQAHQCAQGGAAPMTGLPSVHTKLTQSECMCLHVTCTKVCARSALHLRCCGLMSAVVLGVTVHTVPCMQT